MGEIWLDISDIIGSINLLIRNDILNRDDHHISGFFLSFNILEVKFPIDVDWHLEVELVVILSRDLADYFHLSLWFEDFHSFGFWDLDSRIGEGSFINFLHFEIFLGSSKRSSPFLFGVIDFTFDSLLQAMGARRRDFVAFVMESCTILACNFVFFRLLLFRIFQFY